MFPKNPETVILKNKYYPNGLKEIDIYNYYKQYRNSILNQAKNRNVSIFIKIENSIIIKRKIKENFIRLTNANYDNIISGRTLSFHLSNLQYENSCIVDIDTDDFNKAKEATKDCYDILKKFPIFINLQIRFTGKTSFHIFCGLLRKMEINSIRFLLDKIFRNSSIIDKYSMKKSRVGNTPNIDLYRNVFRGNFIMLNSLSSIGLKCTEVKYNELLNFKKERSIIK